MSIDAPAEIIERFRSDPLRGLAGLTAAPVLRPFWLL